MDYRSELEVEMTELCRDLMDDLWHPKWARTKFRDIMGRIRNIYVKLVKKQYGCPFGLHQGECLCEQGIRKAVATLKNNRRLLSK